jgi:hypothetical protein
MALYLDWMPNAAGVRTNTVTVRPAKICSSPAMNTAVSSQILMTASVQQPTNTCPAVSFPKLQRW